MPDRAIAYIRCSMSRQDLSPDTQRASIDEWAKREGINALRPAPTGELSLAAAT